MNKREAYRYGRQFGDGFACNNVPHRGDRPTVDYVGIGKTVDTFEQAREYHELLCFHAADNARCYSPFEFFATECNAAGEFRRDALWAEFERGARTINEQLKGYTSEDYGFED